MDIQNLVWRLVSPREELLVQTAVMALWARIQLIFVQPGGVSA